MSRFFFATLASTIISIAIACKAPENAVAECHCPPIQRNTILPPVGPEMEELQYDYDTFEITPADFTATITNCTVEITCMATFDLLFILETSDKSTYTNMQYGDFGTEYGITCNLRDNKWYANGVALKTITCLSARNIYIN